MKKWIIRIVTTLIVIVLSVLAYIEINKDKLVALAIDEVNQSIEGTITYDRSDVSLLKTFPHIGVQLYGLNVRDALLKEETPLVQLDQFQLQLDFLSVIRKDIKINAFSLRDGTIYLSDYADGSNNYSLMRTSDNTQSQNNVNFEIEKFLFKDLDIIYRSEGEAAYYKVANFSNQGTLKYIDSWIHMKHELQGLLEIDIASILPEYNLKFSGSLSNTVNPTVDSFAIERLDLSINDLPILASGSIETGSDIRYQFNFSSPSTEIKRLISLLPNFYKNQYDQLIGRGTFVFSGDINGHTAETYPLFKLSVLAQNGSLSYPSKNAEIEKFGFSLIAENTSYTTPYSRIIVNDIDLASGESQISGDLTSIRNGNEHQISSDLKMNIDLQQVARSVVLEPETQLEGLIIGHVKGNGRLNINTGNMRTSDERLDMDILMDKINYKDEINDISLNNGFIKGNQEGINFEVSDLNFNNGLEADLSGHIEQPLLIALDDNATIKGGIDIKAKQIDLDQFTSDSDTSSVTDIFEIPELDLNYSFIADQITQADYQLNDIKATGRLSNEMTSVDFSVNEFKGSTLTGNGNLENILGYSLNGGTLGGYLKVITDQLDLNQFMTTDSETKETVSNELIPENIDLDIDYQSGDIRFKNIDIVESLGQLSIKNRQVILESKGDIFGGKIGIVGTFDNTREEGYFIDFQLDLKELQFGETAAKMKLFNQLIPIAKLLEGDYSASLNWKSDLDNNYVPDLNSLSAYGLVETRNSGITSRLPIDSFIRKLNIVDTKSTQLKLKDAQEYFIIENGQVMLKDLNMTFDDIDINMSGSHSFAQDLNYQLKIDIPKSQLNIDGLLGSLQSALNFSNLLKGATDDVKVQVEALMHGTVTRPKFKITGVNLKKGDVVESLKDQIVTSVEAVADSLTNEIRDTLDAIVSKGKDIIDSANTVITGVIDSSKNAITSVVDSTKDLAIREVETLKDTLKAEGEGMLKDILTGQTDSVDFNIDNIFKDKQGQLDSLAKKFPIGLFGTKKKPKSSIQKQE